MPHIEAAKDLFSKCLKPENRGSKACPPRFQTSLEANSNDNFERTSNSNAIQAQIHSFTNKHGDFSARLCYAKVLRCADAVGNKNFAQSCSYERFLNLAIEDDQTGFDEHGARMAITILQLEAEGQIQDVESCFIGTEGGRNIHGPDYKGKLPNGRIVYIEVKNPVHLGKKRESPFDMGKRFGSRAMKQENYWLQSNAEELTKNHGKHIIIKNLPEQPTDFIIVVDLLDVSQSSREKFVAGFSEGADKPKNPIIYVNKNKDI